MKKILLTALVLLAAASVFAKKNKKDGPLVIGATPVPHVQLLELVKADVEAKGYKLEIREMTDYVILNDALETGELDANFDQHIPYMESTNKDKGYHLVNAGGVHIEPFALYSKKYKTLALAGMSANVLYFFEYKAKGSM